MEAWLIGAVIACAVIGVLVGLVHAFGIDNGDPNSILSALVLGPGAGVLCGFILVFGGGLILAIGAAPVALAIFLVKCLV